MLSAYPSMIGNRFYVQEISCILNEKVIGKMETNSALKCLSRNIFSSIHNGIFSLFHTQMKDHTLINYIENCFYLTISKCFFYSNISL